MQKVRKFFLTARRVWSVSVAFPCLRYSSCIHIRTKVSFVCPHYLPKFWGKKPKETTKVTVTSRQWVSSAQMIETHFSVGFPPPPIASDPLEDSSPSHNNFVFLAVSVRENWVFYRIMGKGKRVWRSTHKCIHTATLLCKAACVRNIRFKCFLLKTVPQKTFRDSRPRYS